MLPPARPGGRAYRWLALLLASLGTLITTLDAGMVNVSYPALAEAFATDVSTVLWVQVAYYLTSTGILLTMGWVSDVVGRRGVFTLGFAVFTVGMGVSALSTSILQLVLVRSFQALGGAMLLANNQALVTAVFPPRSRGMAIGVLSGVAGLGLAGGPLVGGVILDTLGWPALFYTRVPLGLLGTGMAWTFLRGEGPSARHAPVDLLGAATLFVALTTFLLAVNQGGRVGPSSPLVWGLALVTLLALVPFVWAERRAPRPVLDFALFRNRAYSVAVSALVVHFLAWGSVTLLAPFYLVRVMGTSQSLMGLLLFSFTSVRLVVGPLAGWLYDRLGPRLLTTVGMVGVGTGCFLLSRLGPHASLGPVVLGLMVTGLGSATFEPPNYSAIMGAVPPDRLGTAAASIGTGRQIGLSTGIAFAGAMFTLRQTAYLASGPISPVWATASAFGDTMLAAALLAGVGVVISALRSEPPRRRLPYPLGSSSRTPESRK